MALTGHENLERVASALLELSAFLRVSGLTDEEARALPMPVTAESLATLEISTWRTDAGDIDILASLRNDQGQRQAFDDLVTLAKTASIGTVTALVASLEDIIEAKRFANRDKDREALPELEQLAADQPPRN